MIKVCFISNWGETSAQLLNRYKTQTPLNYGVWETIQGVDNIKDADYYVVMDGGIGDLDRSKVIFFQREPSMIKGITENLKGIKFCGTYDTTPQASVWWVKKNFDQLTLLENIPKKTKVSCVMSGKTRCVGHRDRLKTATEYSNSMDIDFWGKHLGKYISRGYKGETDDKFDALYPYEYSFVFENSKEKNYFTEKICDSFLSYTMPLYNGCPNIEEYFPKESYIDISSMSIDQIKDIIEQPLSKENIQAIEYSRDLVLNRYNLWAMIYDKLGQ